MIKGISQQLIFFFLLRQAFFILSQAFQEVGFDDPCRSLSTQNILWFCDSFQIANKKWKCSHFKLTWPIFSMCNFFELCFQRKSNRFPITISHTEELLFFFRYPKTEVKLVREKAYKINQYFLCHVKAVVFMEGFLLVAGNARFTTWSAVTYLSVLCRHSKKWAM